MKDKLRIAVAVLITVIWAVAYSKAFFDRSYTPPAELSGIMLATVTWLFGSPVVDRIREKIKESDHKKQEES